LAALSEQPLQQPYCHLSTYIMHSSKLLFFYPITILSFPVWANWLK